MPPVEAAPGIYAVDASIEDARLEVHLICGESIVVVDCGVAGTAEAYIVPALRTLGRSLDDVSHVLITHGHHDHTGGLAELTRLAPKAKVLVHAADAAWVESSKRYVQEMYRSVWPAVWSPSHDFTASVRAERGEGCPPDGDLHEGKIVDAGEGHRLRVIEVPGHSPGHVALLDEGTGTLVVGDAIPGGGNGPGMFPLYISPAQFEGSLQRIRGAGARQICTTHHGTLDAEGAAALIDSDLRMSRQLQDVIRDALERRGRLDPQTAVAAVRDHWPDRDIGLAICLTVAGHLATLVEDGTASVHGTEQAPEWTRRP